MRSLPTIRRLLRQESDPARSLFLTQNGMHVFCPGNAHRRSRQHSPRPRDGGARAPDGGDRGTGPRSDPRAPRAPVRVRFSRASLSSASVSRRSPPRRPARRLFPSMESRSSRSSNRSPSKPGHGGPDRVRGSRGTELRSDRHPRRDVCGRRNGLDLHRWRRHLRRPHDVCAVGQLMRSIAVVVAIGAWALGACASTDEGMTATPPSAASAPTPSVTSATSDVPTSSTAESDAAIETAAPTVLDAAPHTGPPAESFYGDFDTVIEQRTDGSGGGTRPLLDWEVRRGRTRRRSGHGVGGRCLRCRPRADRRQPDASDQPLTSPATRLPTTRRCIARTVVGTADERR
jgi:hypothetical protein